MEKFGTLDSNEKTIAILGDGRCPQTAKREGDNISEQMYLVCNIWEKRTEPPNVGRMVLRLERDVQPVAK